MIKIIVFLCMDYCVFKFFYTGNYQIYEKFIILPRNRSALCDILKYFIYIYIFNSLTHVAYTKPLLVTQVLQAFSKKS